MEKLRINTSGNSLIMDKETAKNISSNKIIDSQLNTKSDTKVNRKSSSKKRKKIECTTVDLLQGDVKIEKESDDEAEEQLCAERVIKEEISIKREVLQQDFCNKDIQRRNQKRILERDILCEVKSEPVDELYAGHEFKAEMVIGPVVLQAVTNATEEENDVPLSKKPRLEKTKTHNEKTDHGNVRKRTTKGNYEQNGTMSSKFRILRNKFTGIQRRNQKRILERDLLCEVKSEPVDELYADHEFKAEMVIGPVVLQAVTNATEEENDVPLSKKPQLEKTKTRDEKTDHGNVRKGTIKGNYKQNGTMSSKLQSLRNKFKGIQTNKKGKSKKLRNKASEMVLEYNTNKNLSSSNVLECNKLGKHSKKTSKRELYIKSFEEIKKDIYLNCKKCSYQTATQDSLERHMKLHDRSRLFVCDVCGYRYKTKTTLQTHLVNVHSDEKIYCCGFCSYRTNFSSNLIFHLRTHSGEKPFSCSKCEYKCTRKSDLTEHSKIHTAVKPFSCSLCKFKCTRQSNLTAHLRTHTGEKPISCVMCSYRSARKYDMTKHVRIYHTGEKPYSCSLCTYRSVRKDQLTSHWNNNHT